MTFNPLEEKGIPIEKQLRNWSELNVTPYDKKKVHPYSRTRGILMNGIEVEGAIFSHQFARHTYDMEIKKKLAMTRRIEQQQQKAINWMLPADESVLEITIGYEQVAVDLTAFLARTEPDPYVKAALDFALLEDFDHLYRYANLLDLVQGKKAEEITGKYTEITVGRPTIAEHRHPFDDVRKPYDAKKAAFITKLHVLTIVAAEQQTMNFYMNVEIALKKCWGGDFILRSVKLRNNMLPIMNPWPILAPPGLNSWFCMNTTNAGSIIHCHSMSRILVLKNFGNNIWIWRLNTFGSPAS
jgi:hypothetical protein